ncbi:MAG: chromate transporter, partial [Lachnospiraceae bacterium]|nr:chromate transporter [Lachnospiraceae bacterium]
MLAELFFTFAKIGLFTFGGGYAMSAQIKETVVEQKGWLDEEELMQIITVAESTPGPIAINMATYVGYKKKGVAGSVMATLGVVVPSLVI